MSLLIEGLTFRYPGARPIFNDLSWEVPQGVALLLGPNGAGKSTFMGIVATALRMRSGKISLLGDELTRSHSGRRRWRAIVGWVPQRTDGIPGMSAREQVAYCAWLKGTPAATAKDAAAASLEAVGLAERADQRATTLSGGQLRRLGIACALAHKPQLMLLDEPTAGLDPSQRRRLYEVISKIDDVDWIISTHQAEEMIDLGDSVHVMDAGRVVWSGATTSFLELGSGSTKAEQASDAYAQLVGDAS